MEHKFEIEDCVHQNSCQQLNSFYSAMDSSGLMRANPFTEKDVVDSF